MCNPLPRDRSLYVYGQGKMAYCEAFIALN